MIGCSFLHAQVGSAAFNLLCITAVCVSAIPEGEVRRIKDIGEALACLCRIHGNPEQCLEMSWVFFIAENEYLGITWIVQARSRNIIEPSWSTHCQSMSLGASSLRLPGFCCDLLVLGFRLPVAAYYLHALDTWCAAAMLTFSEKLVKYLSVKLLAVLRDIGYRHAWRRADVSTLLPTFPGDHDWRGLPPSQKTNDLVKGDNHVVLRFWAQISRWGTDYILSFSGSCAACLHGRADLNARPLKLDLCCVCNSLCVP